MTRLLYILLCVAVQAQAQKSANEIRHQYDDFKKSHAGVSLMLLFNQEKYAPGDTAWFKAYFLNKDRSAVKGRQLIDIALVAAGGEVLQHFLISVKDGAGFNQLAFPSDLQPGIYTIAAYNSWMKSFNPPPLFSKQVAIVHEKEILLDKASVDDQQHRLNIRPDPERGTVEISFSAQEGSTLRFRELHLVVTSNNRVSLARTFRQALDDSVSFDIKMSPGIFYVSLIDKLGRVVDSQSRKMPAAGDVRPEDKLTVKIERGTELFHTRGKAQVSVTVLDGNGRPVQGEFTFSALNGMLDESNHKQADFLSDALLQQREPWTQIMSPSVKPAIEFTTRLSRSGTAMMSDRTPVPPNTKLVFYLQHSDVILQAQSYAAGRFALSLPDIAGNDELLVFAEHEGADVPVTAIMWDEKSIGLPLPPLSHEGDNMDDYGAFAATSKLIDKSFGFYAVPVNPLALRRAATSGLEERLNGSEVSVNVQKYVTFGTMAELIREIIPGLSARVSKDRTTVKVSLPEPLPVASSDPLYIIDGTVTGNTAYFLSLKPADIATVRLVTSPAKLLPLGLIGKNGIVIVETLKGDVRPPAAAWQVIEGIRPSVSFRKKPSADRPDFRSTIYWEPTVQTDANGEAVVEFYWSDDVGPVRVRIAGMTKDGRFFSGQEEFEVRLEKEKP